MPPLSITMAEIKKMIDVIYRCIRQTT